MDTTTLGAALALAKSIPDTAVSEAAAVLEQAETIVESIPQDYSELSGDVAELKSALSESAGSDIDIVTASNSGTGTTYWYNLPADAVNKVKEKHVLLMKLLSATGLGSGASRIADVYIYYTDNTNTTKAFTAIDGKYYSVPVNTEKTINAISIRITRGTVSETTNTNATFSIVYSEDYVQCAISDLRTQDEVLNGEIDSLKVFDESVLAQNVLYNRTEKSIGKGDTFWVSNADEPKVPNGNDVYVYIYSYSGNSIPASATDLVRLVAYYTDNSATNFNFSELQKWKKITLDSSKTLDHFGLRFRRSSSTLSTDEETSYTVIITDTLPTANQIDEINRRLDFVETEPITDAIVNADNIVLANISDQFTAISSATWQCGETANVTAVVPDGETKITYVWDDANVYGTAALYLYCYSDNNFTDLIRTWATGYDVINAKKRMSMALSDGTKSIRLSVRLFSSSYGDHVPQAGDVAFFKNLRAYFGELALRSDLVVPQVSSLDQSTLFVLRDDWKARIPEIQEMQKDNFLFGIQTDTHFGEIGTGIHKEQYNDLMVNLSKLTEYVGFNFIANLGDIIRGYGGDTTTKMKEAYTELMHRYVSHLHCPFFITPGNHDTNIMYAEEEQDPTLQITKEEMYAKLIPFVKNSAPDIVQNGKSLYYYKDFDVYGIRVIMLNTTDGDYTDPSAVGSVFVISQEQIDWFRTTALDTDNAVIICCHVPLVSGLTTNTVTNAADVMNAIYSFKNNGGKVIGCFYGHTHNQSSKTDDEGIVHITFTQGGFCAEIVAVDLDNGSISTVGLGQDGRGVAVEDRVFSFN